MDYTLTMQIEQFGTFVGYSFLQPELLDMALTHSSWANEHGHGQHHNERLEFLGDAVLELCISKELYKRFPDVREGELTRLRSQLVSESFLAVVAQEIKLDDMLKLGKGEEVQGGRRRASVLSDALEAVLGALFLDGGLPAVQKVIAQLYAEHWPPEAEPHACQDAKSRLQEITQQRFRATPTYAHLASFGPEHARTFEVALHIPDGTIFVAKGSSRKRAEQEAAQQALAFLLNTSS